MCAIEIYVTVNYPTCVYDIISMLFYLISCLDHGKPCTPLTAQSCWKLYKYFVDIYRRVRTVRTTYLNCYHVKIIAPTSSIVSRAHWTAFSLDFKRIVTQWLGTTNHGTIACLEFSALAMSTFTETPNFSLLVQLSCYWVDALWRLFEIKIKENNRNFTVSQICTVFKEYWLSCVSGYAKLSRTDQFKSVMVYFQLVRSNTFM